MKYRLDKTETVQELRKKKQTLASGKANIESKIKALRNKLINETDLDYLQVELIVKLIKNHQGTIRRMEVLQESTEKLLIQRDLDYENK